MANDKNQTFDQERATKFANWLAMQCGDRIKQSEVVRETGLTTRQINRIFRARSGTTRETALLIGRAVGAEDVATLSAAEFDKEIMKSVPKSIAIAFRQYSGMLTDEDIKATVDFINELIEKNRKKYNFSGQAIETSDKK